MDKLFFGITSGVLFSLFLPELLPIWLAVSLMGLGVLLFLRGSHLFAGALLGLGWAVCFYVLQLSWLSFIDVSTPQQIHFSVLSVQNKDESQQIEACVDQLEEHRFFLCRKIRLNMKQAFGTVHSHDQVSALVQLKMIHGLGNPVGFHAEPWLLSNGITAVGSIKKILIHDSNRIGWRESWLLESNQLMDNLKQKALLSALIYGEQNDVSQENWGLLRESGLIHLIAISGAHIGLVAWMAMYLSRLICWRYHDRFRCIHYMVGIGFAFFYCGLADFSPPTIRALMMFTLWALLRIFCRHWSQVRVVLCVTSMILIVNPWAAFSMGFWFSILAVSVLSLSAFLCKRTSVIHVQWLMTMVLLPLQLVWFGGLSLTSFFVNLLAGPWFTFLIVPPALIAGLTVPWMPSFSQWLFRWCNWQLDLVMRALSWLHQWGSGWWFLAEKHQLMLCWAVIFFLIYQYCYVEHAVRRALLLLISTGGIGAYFEKEPDWRVDFLDIGQGLSVLVSQHERALLFDTGDAFGRYNMADAVIEPMLAYRGIRHLDYLVISHKDKDHAANWQQLHEHYPQAQLLSSAALTQETNICQTGQSFRWGRLDVNVLSPIASSGGDKNEDSCVLKMNDGKHSILLTGDIEKKAEKAFSDQPAEVTHADIMSSPHHGSHSSSTEALIQAVDPRWVVHSSGYQNRWHHPHQDIVARYRQFGIAQFNTAETGLVTADISDEIALSNYRAHQPWYQHLNTWLQGDDPLE